MLLRHIGGGFRYHHLNSFFLKKKQLEIKAFWGTCDAAPIFIQICKTNLKNPFKKT